MPVSREFGRPPEQSAPQTCILISLDEFPPSTGRS